MSKRPHFKPGNPCFSCGPSAKRPGWSLAALENYTGGRSHRAACSIEKINQVVEKSKTLLGMPKDYRLAIVPASDTGAIEVAMWNLLGERGVDVLGWEVFSRMWIEDVVDQLKLSDVRSFDAPFGDLPDFSKVDCDRDVVFTWNGTTSGVRVPNGDWIKQDRKGLTLCDATSAVFATDIPWEKLDVVTWSWQKVLGSEAAHGMLALSPRAVERLESFKPHWPIPKIFRLTNREGKLLKELFEGKTLNTPSMLAVEDCLDALNWVESVGGLAGMLARNEANFSAAQEWVDSCDWIEFLAAKPETRSNTAICLKVTDPWFTALDVQQQAAFIRETAQMIANEGAGFEVANHVDAPPSYRLWAGATVETEDLRRVLQWIEWAYHTLRAEKTAQAA